MNLIEIFGIVAGGSGMLLACMTMVQIAPIKINPWSFVAKLVRTAIYGEVSSRLNAIEAKMDKHIEADDRRTADEHRAMILHFNNELLRGIGHTKEEFIEVLAEIDDYERYCKDHKDYKNNRAVLAIETIRENYKDRLKKHDFLSETEHENF